MSFQYSRPNPAQRRAAHVLWEGDALASGVPITAYLPLSGAQNVRVRFKASVAGTLKAEYVRPLGARTVYAVSQPDAATIVAATEAVLDIDASLGEAEALLTFTPSDTGTVTFCDVGYGYGY